MTWIAGTSIWLVLIALALLFMAGATTSEESDR